MKKRMALDLLAVVVAASAIFPPVAACKRTSSKIAARLYFDYPLASFAEVYTLKTGNPNHPDTFSVEVRKIAGNPAGTQFGIRVHGSENYGTHVTDICLNVENGLLSVHRSVSGDERKYETEPPDQGGSLFDYLDDLAEIKKIVETVAAGCVVPDFGFDYPPRPELAATAKYIEQVRRKLLDLKTVDAVAARLANAGSFLRLGTSEAVAVRYRAKMDRDILVRFLDKSRFYATQAVVVQAGSGELVVKLQLPQRVLDNDSTCFAVRIVPRGASWDGKLGESIVRQYSVNGDFLWNLYPVVSSGGVVFAGKATTFYLNWQVLGTRRIIVRLLDAKGNSLAEKSFFAFDGVESSRTVELTVGANIPAQANCKVVARIVPRNSSWQDFLCEKERSVAIKAAARNAGN